MKFRLLSFSILSIAYCLLLTGCKMPNDGIPVYLQVDSVQVKDANGNNAQHNITDVWIETNASTIGAFELPCTVPVLQEGDLRFVLSAGIKESGQSGVRVTYPFYKPDTFSITGIRSQHYTRHPVFKYSDGAVFTFNDDFEFGNGFGPSANFELAGSPDVDSLYGGNRCLKITVGVDSSKQVSFTNKFDLPEGKEIWLEVSYKCEVPFYVGFTGHFNGGSLPTTRVPVVLIAPKAEWNKVYVKFSDPVGVLRADTYDVYFEALRPYGSTGGSVYIDNVKLVHF